MTRVIHRCLFLAKFAGTAVTRQKRSYSQITPKLSNFAFQVILSILGFHGKHLTFSCRPEVAARQFWGCRPEGDASPDHSQTKNFYVSDQLGKLSFFAQKL